MQVNLFLQTKMTSINNSHVIPNVTLATVKLMKDKSEKQFASGTGSFPVQTALRNWRGLGTQPHYESLSERRVNNR